MTAIPIGTGSLIPKIGSDVIIKGLLDAAKAGKAPTTAAGLLSLAYIATVKGTIPFLKATIDLGAAKMDEYKSMKAYTATLQNLNSQVYTKPAPLIDSNLKTKLKGNNNILNPVKNVQIAKSRFPNVATFKQNSVNLGQTPTVTQAAVRSVPVSQVVTSRAVGRLIHNPIQEKPLEVPLWIFPNDSWQDQIKEQENEDLENWLWINIVNRAGALPNEDQKLQGIVPTNIDPLSLGVTAIPLDWEDFDAGWTFGVGASNLINRASLFRQQSQTAVQTQTTGRLTTEIKTVPIPPNLPPKKDKNNWIFPIGLVTGGAITTSLKEALVNPSTENPTELLIFLGKCALYDGGAEHYEKYLKDKEYYKVADFPIATFDQIASGQTSNLLLEKPQTLNIPNEQERQKVMLGIQTLREGLHEFPATVPKSLLRTPNNIDSAKGLKLPSFAAFSAWALQQQDELLGSFPLNFKTNELKEDGTTETKDTQIPNISTALQSLLGAAAVGTTVALRNFNLSQRNTGAINANLVNSQFANESLNALTNCLGCSTSPTVRQTQTPTNTQNPSNYQDMLKEKLVKRQGVVDDTAVSVHEKLEKLQFMTSVVFNSVYKKKSEFEDEEKKMEDLVNRVKKFNKEDWSDFIKAINDDNNALTKNGIKMKLIEVTPTDPNNPYKNPINPNPI